MRSFSLFGAIVPALALSLGALAAQAAPPAFQFVGSVQPNDLLNARRIPPSPSVIAVSADGSTVIGSGTSEITLTNYRYKGYRFAGGSFAFLPLAPGNLAWSPVAVSGDGSVIVGNAAGGFVRCVNNVSTFTAAAGVGITALSLDGNTMAGRVYTGPSGQQTAQLYRWTSGGGGQSFNLPSGGTQVSNLPLLSADGNVCVATVEFPRNNSESRKFAYRWASDGAPQKLEVPAQAVESSVSCVSADGATLLGVYRDSSGVPHGCRWQGATLNTPAGIGANMLLTDQSADGSVLVGIDYTHSQIFRIANGGLTYLGKGHSSPYLSSDGQMVVYARVDGTRADAMLWDPWNGARSLRSVLLRQSVFPEIALLGDFTPLAVKNQGGRVTVFGQADRFGGVSSSAIGTMGHLDGVVLSLDTPTVAEPNPFAGALLDQTNGFTPAISIQEKFSRRIGRFYFPPDGEGPGSYYQDEATKFTSTFSLKVSMAGVDLAALNASTPMRLLFGSFVFASTLGADPKYQPGKTSASFRLPLNAVDSFPGTLKCAWNAKQLTVTVQVALRENPVSDFSPFYSRAQTPGFATPQIVRSLVGSDRGGGQFLLDFRFGDRAGSRWLPVQAEYRSEYVNLDDYILRPASVVFSAKADYTGPVVKIVAPAKKSVLLGAEMVLSGTVADAGGVSSVRVRLNGGDWVSASILANTWSAPLTLATGTNTVEVQAFDVSGNASPIVTSVLRHEPSAGLYTGLLVDITGRVRGWASINLTAKGSFTGKVGLTGKTHAIKGAITPSGTVEATLPRTGLSFSASLMTDGAGNLLKGNVFYGLAGFSFEGARAVYGRKAPFCPVATDYRVYLPAPISLSVPPTSVPAADGVGFLSVAPTGVAKLVAKLPDGTMVTYAGNVDGSLSLPIFVRLYKTGLWAGALKFRDHPTSDCDGDFTWIKPAMAKGYYREGFQAGFQFLACRAYQPMDFSSYANTDGTTANAALVFNGGNLASQLEVPIAARNAAMAVPPTPAGFVLNYDGGEFIDPTSQRKRKFYIVHYPKTSLVAGFFLGDDTVGSVSLVPRP